MTASYKPSEMTYSDYHDSASLCAEVAASHLREYDDYADLHEAVHSAIDGDRLVTNYGYMLVAVLLSDQNPDHPEYCESWTTYAPLSDTSELTWSDAVGAMAYVCYYSDVYRIAQKMLDEAEEDEQA